MKNILVFIKDSKGELEWISEFLRSDYLKEFSVQIHLHEVGEDLHAKKNILASFELLNENVKLIDLNAGLNYDYTKLDGLFHRVLDFSKSKSILLHNYIFKIFRIYLNLIIKLESRSYSHRDFDYIFRDYNLKESVALELCLKNNDLAKVIIFPHSTHITRIPDGRVTKTPQKRVRCDLWLENTLLSTRALTRYENEFLVVGSPVISNNYNKKPLLNYAKKKILIILRDAYTGFGSTDMMALSALENALDFYTKHGFSFLIKMHPRRSKLQMETIQIINKYPSATVFQGNLSRIEEELSFCLSFFSSAVTYLSSRSIPVFDITDYLSCDDPRINRHLLTHFCKDGELVHDYLYYGLQKKVRNFEDLLDENVVSNESRFQLQNLQRYYPGGSNKSIFDGLVSISSTARLK